MQRVSQECEVKNDLSSFLIRSACQNQFIANYLYWFLKVEVILTDFFAVGIWLIMNFYCSIKTLQKNQYLAIFSKSLFFKFQRYFLKLIKIPVVILL